MRSFVDEIVAAANSNTNTNTNQNILIVAHSNSLKSLYDDVLESNGKDRGSVNTGLTILGYKDGKFSEIKFNDASHLQDL
jgi:broad specificity phosphatase PhoE